MKSASGKIFHGYELLEVFPSAGMAEAFKARHRETGRVVFLKRVRLNLIKHQGTLDREMQIYERLRHLQNPHVLQVLDLIRDEQFQAIVMEFADGGDLEGFVRLHGRGAGLPVFQVKTIALELAEAISKLHAHAIVHRDLKPTNVLSAGGMMKLADFGIAKNVTKQTTKKSFKQFGTRGFAAPEQLAGVPAHPSADVYAFGKILIFLLTGNTDLERVSHPRWHRIIVRVIQDNANLRPAMAEILEQLQSVPC